MKEKIKSVSLGLLVVLSLIQTVGLLNTLPSDTNTLQEENIPPVLLMESFTPLELLQPETINVSFGYENSSSVMNIQREEGSYYSELTEPILEMAFRTAVEGRAIDKKTYAEVRGNQSGIELLFYFDVTEEMMLSMYQMDEANYPLPDGMAFRSLFINVEENKALFMGTDDASGFEVMLSLTEEDALALQNLMEEIIEYTSYSYANFGGEISGDRDLYVPFSGIDAPIYYLIKSPDNEEALARTLFDNFAVVRKINEVSAVTYIDSQRAARFYTSGLMEYKDSGMNHTDTATTMEQYAIAVDFVNRHGGFSEDLWLQEIATSETDNTTIFYFGKRMLNGIIEDYTAITVTVERQKVVEYSRDMVEIGSIWSVEDSLNNGLQVLDALIDASYVGEDNTIVDISLRYLYHRSDDVIEVAPVYIATLLDGTVYTVDGHTLDILQS